jgi:hypothetical protein
MMHKFLRQVNRPIASGVTRLALFAPRATVTAAALR